MNTTTKDNKLHPIFPIFFALLIDMTILGISCAFLAKFIISYTNLNSFVLNLIGIFN